MKTFLIAAMVFATTTLFAQTEEKSSENNTAKKTQVVEASCGQCQFGLTGGGCDLAVKVDGKAYYVDGSAMNDHGDAHAHNGMCNAIRKAEVSGEVVNGRFRADHFKLLVD